MKRAYKTYFIIESVSGLVKIGKSTDPFGRMKALNSSNSTRLQMITYFDGDIEDKLHRIFEDIRIIGKKEWYELPREIIELLVVLRSINIDKKEIHERFRKWYGLNESSQGNKICGNCLRYFVKRRLKKALQDRIAESYESRLEK